MILLRRRWGLRLSWVVNDLRWFTTIICSILDGYHFGLVSGQLEQIAPQKLDLLLIRWGWVGRGCHERGVIDDSDIAESWGTWYSLGTRGLFDPELVIMVIGLWLHIYRGHLGSLGQVLSFLL